MKEKIKSYIYIILIAIIISIPLLIKDFNIYIDDGIQHVCRLMGTYQSIIEGQNFPVIMSNFCNGFGYSWNLFYSPITAYIPLLFHFLTNSFVLDLKIFMIFITILSGITMYEFIHKVTKNRYAALLGAVIYMISPYRLTDMYMRIAIAELASFIFLPILFQGLYSLFSEENEDTKKIELLIIIGAIGLILTQIVIAMYVAIIGAIYVFINIKKLKNKMILKKLIVSAILILCITAFFWGPMLEHKVNTQYEVFKEGRMERIEALIYHKVNLTDLLYTPDGEMFFEIGLIVCIGLVFTILVSNKIDSKYKSLYKFSLIAGLISIEMSLVIFPFERLPSILKMLQFSFRMLEFSSFFLSFVVAINYSMLIKNFKMKDVVVLTIITILLTVPLIKNLEYGNVGNESRLWPAVPITDKTKRVHAGCASFEYLPSKAFDNLSYIKKRERKIYITKGSTKIGNIKQEGTNMTFAVSDVKKDTILELPYIYYLGYEIKIKSGEEITNLIPYESKNGFIEIHLQGNGHITVEYTGTTVMKISAILSIVSFTILVLYCCKKRHTNKNTETKK